MKINGFDEAQSPCNASVITDTNGQAIKKNAWYFAMLSMVHNPTQYLMKPLFIEREGIVAETYVGSEIFTGFFDHPVYKYIPATMEDIVAYRLEN